MAMLPRGSIQDIDIDDKMTEATGLSDDESDDDDPQKLILAEEERCKETPLGKFEQSFWWNFIVIGAIVLNTVVLAMEADNPEPEYWNVVDNVFLGIFVVDLAVRLLVYRCNFWSNSQWGWNWFDFTVVALGVLDQWIIGVLMSGSGDSSLGNIFSALRTLRLLRVLRAVRLFKNFPELNRLIMGLVNSIQSVIWIAMMFLFLIFTSSIFVTNIIGKEAAEFEDPEKIKMWFGTIANSMITLSIFLTCDDWSTPARMVDQKYAWMEIFWVWYIVMGAFFIVSLLTGLMADQMMDAREDADSEGKAIEIDELDRQIKRYRRVLNTGSLDIEQFTELVSRPQLKSALEISGIDVSAPHQIKWLFDSFDRDGTRSLSWPELREAMKVISRHTCASGKASVLEVMKLEGRLSKLDWSLASAVGDNDPNAHHSWDQRLDAVHARTSMLAERVVNLEADLMAFFSQVGWDATEEQD